jgi:hypothetical protein
VHPRHYNLLERELRIMRTKDFSKSLLLHLQPSRTRHSTYWDSVIAEARANDTTSKACFVAAGFDMWVIWSQIIAELRRRDSGLFAGIYLPDYDCHGHPSFGNTEPTYGKEVSLCFYSS